MGVWMAIGIALGIAIGSMYDNVPMGVVIGLILGVAFASFNKKTNASGEGRRGDSGDALDKRKDF